MMVFWMVAAGFIAVALFFLLPPMLRRGSAKAEVDRTAVNVSIYKEQFADLDRDLEQGTLSDIRLNQARADLQKRMLEDIGDSSAAVETKTERKPSLITAVLVAVAVPALAITLYQTLGNPQAFAEQPAEIAAPNTADHNLPGQIEAMVAALEQRMHENPDDVDGWNMLGRSYFALRRFAEAANAYGNVVKLVGPNDPNLLLDYADALAMSSNNESLEGRPITLIRRALELDPNNGKGLWLSATYEFDRGNFLASIPYWEKLLTLLTPGSEDAGIIEGNIAQARHLATGNAAPPTFGDASQSGDVTQDTLGEADRTTQISGRVELNPDLLGKAEPDDTVFIFARTDENARMPVAIVRKQLKELPVTFTLDDTTALMPSLKLSDHQNVILVARVSRSGDASSASGDLQGIAANVPVGSDDVTIVIDQIVP
ncbi:MAG: c-type cytochrome biogenesis protein CcmI [Gammaproteobacteria bacterium]|nr:c-type cytochrome biogenesis protein CcmI [Gammaproteobacteria bacterium]